MIDHPNIEMICPSDRNKICPQIVPYSMLDHLTEHTINRLAVVELTLICSFSSFFSLLQIWQI